jgi:putative membrane protein
MPAALATLALGAISASMLFTDAPRRPAAESGLDDATIVAIFDAANTADIETGRLATERAHSKKVRDYGAMLVTDHQAVRRLGRDLAAKLGVTPTPPADDAGARAHAEAMASLRARRGVDFDRAFLRHEVAFHQAVIDAINTKLVPAIKNQDLKELLLKVAPAFEAHRAAAERLEAELDGGTVSATPATPQAH